MTLSPSEPLQSAPHRVAHEGKGTSRAGAVAADQLRSIVERIERMQEEAADIASDIRDIFAESKGNGYDVKTLRKIIALRKLDAAERDEAEHLLDTYSVALGMKPQLEMFEREKQ
jgi:uncharacterized protein (UPF0335 family)